MNDHTAQPFHVFAQRLLDLAHLVVESVLAGFAAFGAGHVHQRPEAGGVFAVVGFAVVVAQRQGVELDMRNQQLALVLPGQFPGVDKVATGDEEQYEGTDDGQQGQPVFVTWRHQLKRPVGADGARAGARSDT